MQINLFPKPKLSIFRNISLPSLPPPTYIFYQNFLPEFLLTNINGILVSSPFLYKGRS